MTWGVALVLLVAVYLYVQSQNRQAEERKETRQLEERRHRESVEHVVAEFEEARSELVETWSRAWQLLLDDVVGYWLGAVVDAAEELGDEATKGRAEKLLHGHREARYDAMGLMGEIASGELGEWWEANERKVRKLSAKVEEKIEHDWSAELAALQALTEEIDEAETEAGQAGERLAHKGLVPDAAVLDAQRRAGDMHERACALARRVEELDDRLSST